jgi:hypothetical protein
MKTFAIPFSLPLPLSILAAAALAGCVTYEEAPVRQASLVPPVPLATQAAAYRPGTGTVERVTAAPIAAAGGTAGAGPSERMNRLTIRMDDRTVQYIDTDAPDIRSGMRVELTPDHFIRML